MKNRLHAKLFIGVFLTSLCVILACLVLMREWNHSGIGLGNGKKLQNGWYQVTDRETLPISVPDTIKSAGSSLEIYYDGDLSSVAGEYMAFSGASYHAEVYWNDSLLHQCREKESGRNQTLLSGMICTFLLPEDLNAGTLRIVFYGNGTYRIQPIWVGTMNAICRSLLLENLFSLIAGIFMLVTGFLCLVAFFVLSKEAGSIGHRILHIGFYLIFCSLWTLTDLPIVQFLTNYSDFILYLSFYMFMVLMMPILSYLLELKDLKEKRPLKISILAAHLNILVQSVLCLAGRANLYEMLPATQIMYILMISALTFTTVREGGKSATSDIRLVFHAYRIVGFICILSMLSYMMGFSFYRIIFHLGILLFIGILLYGLGREYWENLRYRAQAEYYRQMAEEDKLTGLGNRRSYEQMLHDIESNRSQYPRAAMIFADLNGLKYINDHFGHSEGDHLIQVAAGCIRAAYSAHGECFRIGGDEFSIIFTDQPERWGEFPNRLQEEIDSYNRRRERPYALSIAWGMSILTETMSIKEWKEAADREMYRHKQSSRASHPESTKSPSA